MKVLADTSVLVAAMVEQHPDHESAFPWLLKAQKREVELAVCSHTLAELYAVLTTLPVRPRLSPDTVRRLIRTSIEPTAAVVALSAEDYRKALDAMSVLGLSGGVVYDALAVRAAQKAAVDKLLTFNVADFRRAWPEGGDRVVQP